MHCWSRALTGWSKRWDCSVCHPAAASLSSTGDSLGGYVHFPTNETKCGWLLSAAREFLEIMGFLQQVVLKRINITVKKTQSIKIFHWMERNFHFLCLSSHVSWPPTEGHWNLPAFIDLCQWFSAFCELQCSSSCFGSLIQKKDFRTAGTNPLAGVHVNSEPPSCIYFLPQFFAFFYLSHTSAAFPRRFFNSAKASVKHFVCYGKTDVYAWRLPHLGSWTMLWPFVLQNQTNFSTCTKIYGSGTRVLEKNVMKGVNGHMRHPNRLFLTQRAGLKCKPSHESMYNFYWCLLH